MGGPVRGEALPGPSGPTPFIRSSRMRCNWERIADVRSSRGSRVSANSRSKNRSYG